MAVVFLARDRKHDRLVALKVMRPALTATIGAQRFLREVEIAAKLNHPHILMLIESGEADGFLYYVMPFVEGESLRQRLVRERQLPLDDALGIAREIADALSAAHAQGVIHRDVKPENVLLVGGHAVVADFGVARAVSAAGGTLTTAGTSVGTPLYMSPEQAGGDPLVDARSDIYSLGCVLYEMLVGEPPFSGPSLQAIIARHALQQIPKVRTVRETVPPHVEWAVEKALAKLPADRFQSAEEFGAALVGVRPPSDGETEDTGALRHKIGSSRHRVRLLLWGSVALTILLASSLGFPRVLRILTGKEGLRFSETPSWAGWLVRDEEYLPTVAVTESLLVVQPFQADSAYVFNGATWMALALPDSFELRPYTGTVWHQQFLATKTRVDSGGRVEWQLWWVRATESGIRPVEPVSDFLSTRPFWWSDGHDLVTWGTTVMRRTPDGWVREPTSTAAAVSMMWGLDLEHRYGLSLAEPDSLLVRDRISWRLTSPLPDESLGRPRYSAGTTLADGTTVVTGEVCDDADRCRPLILEQDSFGGTWRELLIPTGIGIPREQRVVSGAPCRERWFSLNGVSGADRDDFYVWGEWETCDPGPPLRGGVGCPPQQPCLWHVVRGVPHPEASVLGQHVLTTLLLGQARYVVTWDGSLWRGAAEGWRAVTRVPGLTAQLVAAGPRIVLRWKDGRLIYEPGPADSISEPFIFPLDVPPGVTQTTPPVDLQVHDSAAALLTADGTVYEFHCGMVLDPDRAPNPMLRCGSWERLPLAPGHPVAMVYLRDGRLLGVGGKGLIVAWENMEIGVEHLPQTGAEDSLWAVAADTDGGATAIGWHGVWDRDALGNWTLARRSGSRLVGNRFATVAGAFVVAWESIRLWDRSADTIPVATLFSRSEEGPTLRGLHALPDGRLVAGFAYPGEPALRGYLLVWQQPLRADNSQRVDLPLNVDVTDMADDGEALHVVGRGGALEIAVDSLPFGG